VNEELYLKAMELLESSIDRYELTELEFKFFEFLTDLIYEYEKNIVIEKPSFHDKLCFRLDQLDIQYLGE
jgi:hypothetical protein